MLPAPVVSAIVKTLTSVVVSIPNILQFLLTEKQRKKAHERRLSLLRIGASTFAVLIVAAVAIVLVALLR